MVVFLKFWIYLALNPLAAFATVVHLNVTSEIGAAISPLLHGIVIFSGDGGLYGQLLTDPNFLATHLSHIWEPLNDRVKLKQDGGTPLSSAITTTLKLSVDAGTNGRTGVVNRARRGFRHQPVWNCTFYIKGAFDGVMSVEIFDPQSAKSYDNKTVEVHGSSNAWTRVSVRFLGRYNILAPYLRWRLVFDSALIAGRSINLGYPTLFGFEFGSELKFNPDLLELFSPRLPFLRFPGGENLLGSDISNRWKWNQTIGPLISRPGRIGAYGYPNSDGLGLLEYLLLCEHHQMAPILSVWSGRSDPPIVGPALGPYIDEALGELEFILGSTSTPGGRLRKFIWPSKALRASICRGRLQRRHQRRL